MSSPLLDIVKLPINVVTQPQKPTFVDPFLAHHAETLRTAGSNKIDFDAWDYAARGDVGMDIEVFRNCFIVCFKRFSDNTRIAFEKSDRSELDVPAIQRILRGNTIYTFNGIHYDMIILTMALRNASCQQMKDASDAVIKRGERLNIRGPQCDHVDLFEPNPSIRAGLKVLNARLHGCFLLDLPFNPDDELTFEQMNVLALYCGYNDLDSTHLIYNAMREPIQLRETVGREVGLDLRSRSDSQMGEAIVLRRVEQAIGQRLRKPDPKAMKFGYKVPDFVSFVDPQLRDIVEKLRTAEFSVNEGGDIKAPTFLDNLDIRIGTSVYKLGSGGLHSQEAHRALKSDDEEVLIEVDVSSEYPTLISKLGLYPPSCGITFLDVYREMLAERLDAKRKIIKLNQQIAELEMEVKNAKC